MCEHCVYILFSFVLPCLDFIGSCVVLLVLLFAAREICGDKIFAVFLTS
jgi:hypothetical protein